MVETKDSGERVTNPVTVTIINPRKEYRVISIPNNKILHWSKFEASADEKMNVVKKLKFVHGRVEHIVEKEENAGYQHFLLFPQCFQTSLFGVFKSGVVW